MAGEIVASEGRNWWKWRRDELTGAICIINPAGTEYEISAPRLAQLDRDVATLLNDMLEGLIDLQNENEALRKRVEMLEQAVGDDVADLSAAAKATKAAREADADGYKAVIAELRAEVERLKGSAEPNPIGWTELKFPNKHCETCKHRDEDGDCLNEKIAEYWGQPESESLDRLLYSGFCSAIWVGPKFGCVHHEEKSEGETK